MYWLSRVLRGEEREADVDDSARREFAEFAAARSSALMIRMRNLSMGMMTRWPMRALIAKQFQKADAITLKDY
jgi:hypothetical protein